MLLEFNSFSYLFVNQAVVRSLRVGSEIPLKDLRGDSLQFFCRVASIAYCCSILVVFINICGKKFDIPKQHRTHIFPQKDRNCVGFLTGRTPGTPDIDVPSQPYDGQDIFADKVERLKIPKEERKSHVIILPVAHS